MGNRAVICTREDYENDGVGVYLHWNGGRDSVEPFLRYCELKGYRTPDEDCYGYARLIQVIGNFFGGALSLGVDRVSRLDCDNGDNGVYIIEGWKIVGRENFDWEEQTDHDFNEMLQAIDKAQPVKEQLGKFLTAEEIPTSEVNVGDTVYVRKWDGEIQTVKILGFGDGRVVNGVDTTGLPYADICGNGIVKARNNPNNYIRTATVKRVS